MNRPIKSTELMKTSRPGDGFAVPISKRLVPQLNGSTLCEVSVNFAEAPVPQRRYHADVANVITRNDSVYLTFGQVRLIGTGLRSLVIVAMSHDSVRQFVSNTKKFLPAIDAFLARNGNVARTLTPIEEEPAQTVVVAANLVAAAHAGGECTIDFFHMSPWGAQDLPQRSTVPLDPIVRIDLSTSLVSALVHGMAAVDNQLPQEASDDDL